MMEPLVAEQQQHTHQTHQHKLFGEQSHEHTALKLSHGVVHMYTRSTETQDRTVRVHSNLQDQWAGRES